MLNRTVFCWLLLGSVALCPAQGKTLTQTLNQRVTAHFREVPVAAALEFISMHGVDVVARTSDINLQEKLALNVTSATMRDLMQAIASALDARWTRFGGVFVLCRSNVEPGSSAYVADFRKSDGSPLEDEGDTTPSAVVTEEGSTDVHAGSISKSHQSYTVQLSSDGEWHVVNSWRTVDKQIAHILKPRLSVGQKRTLQHRGYLKLDDLIPAQVASLGEAWPDGFYHAKSGPKSLVIRP